MKRKKGNKISESVSMDEITKRLNYLETELQKISFINLVSNPNPLFGSKPQITTFDEASVCNCANNENKKENTYDLRNNN